MKVKELLSQRDKLRNYLHSLSIAKDYVESHIGNDYMNTDLNGIYDFIKSEYDELENKLNAFKNMEI